MIFFAVTAKAQTESSFKPNGKPVFLIFSDVKNSFSKDGSSTAFEISRLYLGYEHFFSNSLSARAVMDVGDPGVGGLQMTAYVKNAFLQYRTNSFSGRFGMIGTDAFGLIEKQWGHRYISKTLQDEFGFNPSADLGVAVDYSPSEFISFDASVLNGEGYKKLQADSALKYTAGITLKPLGGLLLRVYADIMKKNALQNTISFFAGYTYRNLGFGIEYADQKSNKMINNHDYSGISAFGNLKLNDKTGLFARYDYLWSCRTNPTDPNPWNYNNDGQVITAGFDYSPVSGIRIAPVYIGKIPANGSNPFTSAPGLYLEIKL